MGAKTRGVIAAGHQQTAAAGSAMLAQGGNAFDGAIAALLAAFVVESPLTSAGGGGFLMAYTSDRQSLLFDFFSHTPKVKRPTAEVDFQPIEVNFGPQVQVFHVGRGAIAMPGNLAGLLAVHQQLGRLPLAAIAEPAIDYAQQGFVLTSFQHYCRDLLTPIHRLSHGSREIYFPNGTTPQIGDRCTMPDVAATLTALSRTDDTDAFVRGEFARQIVKDLREGGQLTQVDFEQFAVKKRRPLRLRYRGYELLMNPPPSSGGILIAFALQLLSNQDLSQFPLDSCEHLQLLAQVMRLTNEGRQQGYDGQLYDQAIAKQFLDPQQVRTYQQQLQTAVNKWGSTTHISVMDEEGNAASVTTSNGEGSGYVVPNTGIMLNNMLGEADLNPGGFHRWPCDHRLSSMMAPTLILKDGQPMFALGSGGSNRIRTAMLQVISNLLDHDCSLEAAIQQPRVHWEQGVFSAEPTNAMMDLRQLDLPEDSLLKIWPEQNMFFGGVHGVGRTTTGEMVGVGDSRRAGVAICI